MINGVLEVSFGGAFFHVAPMGHVTYLPYLRYVTGVEYHYFMHLNNNPVLL